MRSRWIRVDDNRRMLWLMLAATFATGIVDAVGFLGLDRVFTGNMTGNVVILGMALTGADGLPVLGPACALAGFMIGAAVGGRVLRGSGAGWNARSTVLFAVVGTVMMIVGAILLCAGSLPQHRVAVALTTTLGTAMGLQASAARHVGVKDVTTVVVTSTITGLSADSRLAGGDGANGVRRLLAVALILAGAVVGAALVMWHLGAGPLLAGAVVLGLAVLGSAGTPRDTTDADRSRSESAGAALGRS